MKKVCKLIFKILLIIIICCILLFAVKWAYDYSYCQYLTLRYGYQFKDLYKENTMIGPDLFYLKVMKYDEEYADIYYVTGNKETGRKCGNGLVFEKENGKWVFTGKWSTIWTELGGSADGYIWPYGR